MPKPFAFINLDLFNQNIQSVLKRSENIAIRVASKSVRSVPMLSRILQSNHRFIGIMAYHPLEAVSLSKEGFKNILMGYPCVDKAYIEQILNAPHPIIFMVDAISQLENINEVAERLNKTASVCLDVDMSSNFPGLRFGVWRSSTHNAEQALSIYHWIRTHEHIQLKGIMGYEAQIAGLGNHARGEFCRNKIITLLQNRSKKEVARRREIVVKELQNAGAVLEIVNAGGTGSIESSKIEPWVNEITVGSAFYSPALFDHYQHFRHEPAAGFVLEITRNPQPNIYTCHAGGYIASGQIDLLKQPASFLPKGIKITRNEGFGEVQTPFMYQGDEQLRIGSPVFFRHAKAGELMEHFNTIHLIEDNQHIGTALTYRGMGWSFC